MNENYEEIEEIEEVIQEEQPEEEVIEDQVEQEEPQEQKKDHPNFAQLREQKEQLRRENEEIRRQLAAYQQQFSQHSSTATTTKEQHLIERKLQKLNADDLAEGRHYNDLVEELEDIKKRSAERDRTLRVEKEMNNVRMRNTDYAQVVTQENLERLVREQPALAMSLDTAARYAQQTGEGIEASAQAAYDLIKKLGYDKSNEYEDREIKSHINNEKPRPAQSTTPLAKVSQWDNGPMSEEEKERHRQDMARLRRMA